MWNLTGVPLLSQWLARELAKLDALIDRSNEKGWRKEYPSLYLYITEVCVLLSSLVQTATESLGKDIMFRSI